MSGPTERMSWSIRQHWNEARRMGLDNQLAPLAGKYPEWRSNEEQAADLRIDLICIVEGIPLDEETP